MKSFLCSLLVVLSVPSISQNKATQWDPFLDTLQQRTVRWFLDTTPDSTGLTPDRWPTPSPSSIAAVGFALTTYPIAAERKIITRDEAATRTLKTLRFLLTLPQSDKTVNVAGFKGFFYHFIDMRTGLRAWNCELSTIDTGLLLAGALFCQSYFDRPSHTERQVRAFADSLYKRTDWQWAMAGMRGVAMGWKPEDGIHPHYWRGYNEAMILYVLALGSPTYPVPESVWEAWTETYIWAKFEEYEYTSFAPLFGFQYSHCWIDFHGIQDRYMREKGIDYFENSRRATYAQWEYVKKNPGGFKDYSSDIWGLTACDGPGDTTIVIDGRKRTFLGYAARGASFDWTNDDGTLTPTAPGGSLPFAPDICIASLKAMKEKYGSRLWTSYGFRDAFNPTYVTPSFHAGWFDKDYLGIDQGPIVLMIENLRNGFVWEVMKKNPYIVQGLKKAGFSGGWLSGKK